MDCFRQIYRLVKSPFQRTKRRGLEIGPPTDFRKEQLPSYFGDDEFVPVSPRPVDIGFNDDSATTLNSHTALEKDAIVHATEQEPSARDRIRSQVRRMSVKISRPLVDTD
ncbi:hypothetical protein BJX99DRAFT_101571 [Aspergillus californicus]